MDFDPDNEKWQCCFCRIPTGLKFLGLAECVMATGVLLFGLHLIHIHSMTDKEDFFALFDLSLCTLSVLFGLSSLLMSAGVHFHREHLLYPSVTLRVLFVIFVTVFGVSIGVVRPPVSADVDADDEYDEDNRKMLHATQRKQKMGTEKRTVNQEEPSTVLRLVFLMFIMLFVSILMFYTIFLVLRSIRFIRAYKRLQRRRSSFFLVGQIDPSQMNNKRPSQCSQMY